MQIFNTSKKTQFNIRVFPMKGSSFFKRIRQVGSVVAVTLVLSTAFASQAHAVDKVTTYKDENGWKLQVNGEDYYI